MTAWNNDISQYNILERFLVKCIQETIPIVTNGYETLISKLRSMGTETMAVSQIKDNLNIKMKTMQRVMLEFEAGQLARIQDLNQAEINLRNTKVRLFRFAKNTRASCEKLQEHFDWLKNAHITLQNKISSYSVDNKELNEVLQGALSRFYSRGTDVSSGNMREIVQNFNGVDRLSEYKAKWNGVEETFNRKIKRLRKEANDIEYIVERIWIDKRELFTYKPQLFKTFEGIQQTLREVKDENIAMYTSDLAVVGNMRLPSFVPSTMPDMEFHHFMLMLRAEREYDNTIKILNRD